MNSDSLIGSRARLRLHLRIVISLVALFAATLSFAQGDAASVRNHLEKFEQYRLADHNKALGFARLVEGAVDSLPAESDYAVLCDFLADNAENHIFDYSEALRYKARLVELYAALGDSLAEARATADLGRLYFKVGDYHNSFTYSNKALARADSIGDNLARREALMSIELVDYFYYKDTTKAMSYNRLVADNYNGREEARQAIRALNNRFHYPLTPSEVEDILQRSAQIHSEFGFDDVQFNIYLNAALQQVLFDDLDACAHYLDLAKPMISNFKEEGYYYSASGFYNINRGHYSSAISDTRRSIELLSRGDFDEKNVHSYFLLQELYFDAGRYRDAYNALMQFCSIYTRQNSSESVVQLSKLINELELQYAEKQRIEQLERARRDIAEQRERQTLYMVICLLVLLLLVVALVLLYSRQKLERKNRRLLHEKSEQELRNKNEVIKIQKLQQYQEQRNLQSLTAELSEAVGATDSREMRNRIHKIIARLSKGVEADWVEVEKTLIDTNNTFFENLIKAYPNLTKNERKLCTFIHLNLSTKEISNITHQSVGSINIARSRLRAKFGIKGDDRSLIAFLDKFDSAPNQE